jgi:hypothetical protein
MSKNPCSWPRWTIALLFVAFLLSACQQPLPFKATQKVSDSNSPLLGALMNRSDMPGNWVWYRDDLYQAHEAFTSPSYKLIDAAAHGVTGDYGAQRYYIQTTHRLERYEPASPPLETLKQWIDDSFAEEEKSSTYAKHAFSPSLVSVGTGLVSKCVSPDPSRNPPTTGVEICLVAARYNHIVSKIIFYAAPGSLNDNSATEILNQILTTTDGRIKEIDK